MELDNRAKKSIILYLSLMLFFITALAYFIVKINYVNSFLAIEASKTPTPTNTPVPTPTIIPTPKEEYNYIPLNIATSSPFPVTPPPTPTPTPVPTPIPQNGPEAIRYKFGEKFSSEEILTDTSYSCPDMAFNWRMIVDTEHFSGIVTYYVADIYVTDATMIKTGFATGSYRKMGYKSMEEISESVDAIIAVSGDFAHFREEGLVIRNGEVCRTKLDNARDIGVLYRDGSFETYLAKHVPLKEILEKDPWQCWCFGPSLLDENGGSKLKFNTNVSILNPRAVFGYYEPGHYCFVIVDGRNEERSVGLTMQELSLLMESLGCKAAINLDGGSTAQFAWESVVINDPFKDRLLHDIIYLGRMDNTVSNITYDSPISSYEKEGSNQQ